MFWKEPDEDLLLALAEPQLDKAKPLAHEFVFFDRAEPNSQEKSLTPLNDAAGRAVQRRRTELNLDTMAITPKVASITDRGKEKGKGCKDRRVKPQ